MSLLSEVADQPLAQQESLLSLPQRRRACESLEGVRQPLAEAVRTEQLRNPFWEERHGGTAPLPARPDPLPHLDHLIAAVAANDPALFADYNRQLRADLVGQGLCTYHVWEKLETLDRHLQLLLPAEWPCTRPYLQAGFQALRYDHPICQALAPREAAVAAETTRRLYLSAPPAAGSYEFGPPESWLRENHYLLSYLQDSLALGNPSLFAAHLKWLAGFLARQGFDVRQLYQNLRLLAEALAAALDPAPARLLVNLLFANMPPVWRQRLILRPDRRHAPRDFCLVITSSPDGRHRTADAPL